MTRRVLTALLLALLAGTLSAQQPVQTFTITEPFGVSHPEQIIDFDLDKPVVAKNAYVLDAAGNEVVYQLLEGGKKLALRTNLPDNSEKSWSLYTGRAPKAAAGGIKVVKTPAYYEIVNDLVGLRIPLPATTPIPTPAPVQGVRLRDGAWTATGPNVLSLPAKSVEVKFLEAGPLKVVVQVAYAFDKPAKTYGDRPVAPAGAGYYTSTITVEAGQPSILFEEDSDCDLDYSLDLYPGLQPDQARYRGHHSSSKELGREADGRQYRMWHERAGMDALVDYRYDVPRTYRKLAVWDPWIFDSGWYWQFYNSTAPGTANLAGIFAGPASRAIGTSWSGVNLYTAPKGITDLTTAQDAAGNLHAAYLSGTDLYYVKFDSRLNATAPEKVAGNIANPDLLIREDGSIALAGYDTARKAFVVAERIGNTPFIVKPVPVDTAALKISEPYIYQASAGGTDYLLLFGSFAAADGKTQTGGLLFARGKGEPAFAYQECIPQAQGYRQIVRPQFTRMPDGRVALLFSYGQYAEIAWIAPGARTFADTTQARRLFNNEKTRLLDFGAALDAQTGTAVVGNQAGVLTALLPDGRVITSEPLTFADHGGQGPNRRTAALAPDGTLLAVHNGAFFRCKDGRWSACTEANELKLISPRVHYLPGARQFVLLGRKDGMLTVYAMSPGEAPTLARSLPETDLRAAGLTVSFERGNNNPPGAFTPRVRFAWGLFLGTKGADLGDPYKVQNIARQMNIHAGISLAKLVRWQLDFPDPKRGYGTMFMDRDAFDRLQAKLRADKGGAYGGGFHQYLFTAEPYSRDLVTMWADPTGQQNTKAVDGILTTAQSLLDGYVNGDGIYDMHCHYWHGGLAMNSKAIWGDQALASAFTTPEQKTKVKAALALFGNIMWDNDFVPLDNPAGVNLGTENMPVQQVGYRRAFALLLGEHPTMRPRAQTVKEGALQTVRQIVNESGAEIGCVHYIGASFAPTLATLLQIKQGGEVDPFKVEPRLSKFAEFYMNFQTPPEVRFGTTRKQISTGDGPTESSEMLGMLATGFRDADPDLSARLMGAWKAGGKVHSGFFGSTFLMIDEDAPAKDAPLGDANFPGYYSVLRHGWGTPNETALWFLNGDFYRDHRHHDRGNLIAYALGLPLSLDWGAQYAPSTPGAFMHSTVLLEPMIGQPWNQDVKSLEMGTSWRTSEQEAYAAFRTAAYARGKMTTGGTTWHRAVYALHPNEAYPVLIIRDSFDGENAAAPKVFTLNLMAEGPVQTPAGPITPPVRTWGDGYSVKVKHEFPSAGPQFTLNAGMNRLGFTGVQFGTPEKPAPGIDFDLYTIADAPLQGQVGNWADNWVGGAAGDFQRVNGKAYEERQHILRLRGTSGFTTVILPWRKGQPHEAKVESDGKQITITAGNERLQISDRSYRLDSPTRKVAAFFGTGDLNKSGAFVTEACSIENPGEIVIEGTTATLTCSGTAGPRAFILPGAWKLKDPKAIAKLVDGTWIIDYAGEAPLTVELVKK